MSLMSDVKKLFSLIISFSLLYLVLCSIPHFHVISYMLLVIYLLCMQETRLFCKKLPEKGEGNKAPGHRTVFYRLFGSKYFRWKVYSAASYSVLFGWISRQTHKRKSKQMFWICSWRISQPKALFVATSFWAPTFFILFLFLFFILLSWPNIW